MVRRPGGPSRQMSQEEWNGGGDPGVLSQEGKALLGQIICRGPEFLVTPLLMGPVCLISHGRFEQPVRP